MWSRHRKWRPNRSSKGTLWRTPLGGTLARPLSRRLQDKMAHSKKIDFLVHRSKGHTFRNSTCTIRKKLEGEVIPAYTEDEELD